MIYLYRFLLLTLVLYNSTDLFGQYSDSAVKLNLLNVDTVDIYLAYELCKKDSGKVQYSPCGDGIGEYFGFPYFVKLNFKSYFLTMKDTMYTNAYSDSVYNNYSTIYLAKEFIVFFNPYVTYSNRVSIFNRKMKNGYDRRIRKLRKFNKDRFNKYFDGKIYYNLYKMKIVRGYVGLYPKFKLNTKGDFNIVDLPTYFIIEILEIHPVTKEEFIKNKNY